MKEKDLVEVLKQECKEVSTKADLNYDSGAYPIRRFRIGKQEILIQCNTVLIRAKHVKLSIGLNDIQNIRPITVYDRKTCKSTDGIKLYYGNFSTLTILGDAK